MKGIKTLHEALVWFGETGIPVIVFSSMASYAAYALLLVIAEALKWIFG